MTTSRSDIAFFDFDGTVTSKDSLFDFVRFAVGSRRFYLGLVVLSPILTAFKLHVISSQRTKERFMSHFFANCSDSEFRLVAEKYSVERIDRITRPDALDRIAWHQAQGHEVVIVSASMEDWLAKWCEKLHLGLIATRMEEKNGKLTGKFATKNCSGVEKVNRIKERYELSEYDRVFAYGNSRGDRQMLEMSNRPYFRCFS